MQPYKLDFFQAVRLMECIAANLTNEVEQIAGKPVGYAFMPRQECIRFRSSANLDFPISPINKICLLNDINLHDLYLHFAVEVNFIGLVGAHGVLPNHYTELLLQHLRIKDTSLRDFYDLFNHRIISLFYRAWKKHQLIANHSQFSYVLSNIIGVGGTSMQKALSLPLAVVLFYSGLYCQPRSAILLAGLLSDYFTIPVTVKQFQVTTIYLPKCNRTRIATQRKCEFYHQLGVNALLGDRVRSTQHKFRLQIGLLTYKQFKRLLPHGDMLQPLCELTRLYIGINLHFDMQLLLKSDAIPPCQLMGKEELHLGWNIWLGSRDFVTDIIFPVEFDMTGK